MAHHTYKTDTLVLSCQPVGERNMYYVLFTKDFGRLYASAQGIRKMESKLRYHLQDQSFATVFLVYGKGGWRITNAEAYNNFFYDFNTSKNKQVLTARIVSLLRMFLTGEEKNEELFSAVIDGLTFLATENLGIDSVHSVEHILVLRMLQLLGYVEDIPVLQQFLTKEWNVEIIESMKREKGVVVQAINRSLQASHLF